MAGTVHLPLTTALRRIFRGSVWRACGAL